LTSEAVDAKLFILKREITLMNRLPAPQAEDKNKTIGGMSVDEILKKAKEAYYNNRTNTTEGEGQQEGEQGNQDGTAYENTEDSTNENTEQNTIEQEQTTENTEPGKLSDESEGGRKVDF
jgi:hypothetical protein